MGGIRRTDCNNLVVCDEYVGPKSQVGECCFYGFGVEYAGLQTHVVFDDEGVASAVECVVGGECSAVLCAQEFQRFQDGVEVEFLEPEGYDSWSLVLAPPASHLFCLFDG